MSQLIRKLLARIDAGQWPSDFADQRPGGLSASLSPHQPAFAAQPTQVGFTRLAPGGLPNTGRPEFVGCADLGRTPRYRARDIAPKSNNASAKDSLAGVQIATSIAAAATIKFAPRPQ